MKIILSLTLLSFLTACGHTQKVKNPENTYSPKISFTQDANRYEAKVQLPKDFKDKLPLVVIIHEWWGRNDYVMGRSDMLNKEGYATLVVDLYGNGKTVQTPAEAQDMATPFYKNPEAGIKLLTKYVEMAKKDPHVDASKVYVIGYCFGGTQALNFARSGADIKGVVSFHGGLATTVSAQGLKADVLALNGLADPFVPAKERQAFEKEMKKVKAKYKVVNYKGATHAFTNPNSTAVGKKYNIPIAYNKKADEASWKEFLTFLKKK